MKFQTEICHINETKVVVRANAWDGDVFVGSALGESKTAEEAEERAIERLEKRYLNQQNNEKPSKSTSMENPKHIKDEERKTIKDESINTKTISKEKKELSSLDWTEELLLLDLELKRLGWNKDKERIYLNKVFGYNSRNKITDISKLKVIIELLKELSPEINPEDIIINEGSDILIRESDVIIKQLGWDNKKARIFLKELLGANSRKEITIEELKSFIKELKKQLR
tara:strand:+ start:71 stop:751 length:681 start_codon:yes stop_codon:yes gene_type:complete